MVNETGLGAVIRDAGFKQVLRAEHQALVDRRQGRRTVLAMC